MSDKKSSLPTQSLNNEKGKGGREGRVDLDGGDGSLPGGGDPLLHGAHVGGQGGLIANGRGDAAQQRRHLGAGLGESGYVCKQTQ